MHIKLGKEHGASGSSGELNMGVIDGYDQNVLCPWIKVSKNKF